MKKKLLVIAAVSSAGLFACKSNNADDANSDTARSVYNSTDVQVSSTIPNTAMDDSMDPDPTVSYTDLKSGRKFKIRRDTATRYMMDEQNAPVSFYINPATNDTFDRSGRNVNNAMVKGSNGDWTVDESRIKVKTQGDGDLKMKDKETNDKVKLETNGDGKIKTDSSKIKIKDGSIKEKKQ